MDALGSVRIPYFSAVGTIPPTDNSRFCEKSSTCSFNPCHHDYLLSFYTVTKNIPADFHKEHLNRLVNDAVNNLLANKTAKARVKRAIGIVPASITYTSE